MHIYMYTLTLLTNIRPCIYRVKIKEKCTFKKMIIKNNSSKKKKKRNIDSMNESKNSNQKNSSPIGTDDGEAEWKEKYIMNMPMNLSQNSSFLLFLLGRYHLLIYVLITHFTTLFPRFLLNSNSCFSTCRYY